MSSSGHSLGPLKIQQLLSNLHGCTPHTEVVVLIAKKFVIFKMQDFYPLIIIIYISHFFLPLSLWFSHQQNDYYVGHASPWIRFHYSKAQLPKWELPTVKLILIALLEGAVIGYPLPPITTILIFFFIFILISNVLLRQRKSPTVQVKCGWCTIRCIWQS